MRRSRAAKSTVSVELFPFLAVLMCTMGALILLLLVIARQAHDRAEQEALAAARPTTVEPSPEELALVGRIDLLGTGLTTAAADLERRRQELSVLEDRARLLRRQLAELEGTEPGDVPEDDAELQRRLAALRARIAATEEDLDKARFAAANATSAYAIVPYVGPNGTARRPIYVECRADAIIVQPEGIRLTESDFPEPLGDNNPLAAAVRVAGEYYARMDAATGLDSGSPYPLLLVRPDGIQAYYIAREALSSWKNDFGYELIDDDWKLKYDPPNKALAQMQLLAVQDARGKQRMLALAAPRYFTSGRRAGGFRPAPGGGGLVRDSDGHPVSGRDIDRFYGGSRAGDGRTSDSRYSKGGFGSGNGFGSQGDGIGSPQGASSERSFATGGGDSLLGGNAAPGSDPLGTAGTGSGRSGSDSLLGGGLNQQGNGLPPGAAAGSGYSGAPPAGGYGQPGGGEPSGGEPGSGRPGGSGGTPSLNMGDPSVAAAAGREANAPRGTRPTADGATASDQRAATAEWRPGEYHEPGSRSSGADPSAAPAMNRPPPIAARRGADWALPDTSNGSIALTRPIRIECDHDHLRIVPEGRNDRGGKRIELDEGVSHSMDDLVGGVWEVMDGWGIAGKGMYWRPILQFDVKPSGEARYAEVEALLQGSGLTVEKKSPPPARQNPTQRTTRRPFGLSR